LKFNLKKNKKGKLNEYYMDKIEIFPVIFKDKIERNKIFKFLTNIKSKVSLSKISKFYVIYPHILNRCQGKKLANGEDDTFGRFL
jgi:hypothetical protein